MPGVAPAVHRKRTLGQELRDIALRGCLAGGLLGAVWWGFKHPEHVNRCSTRGPATVAFEHCTSSTLTTVALYWVAIIGAGLAVGVALAVALALTLSLLTRMRGHLASPSRR
jgi:hypothetical protein